MDRCKTESKAGDVFDIRVYSKLLELDVKLGIAASDQLFGCLLNTTRSDIIKVASFVWIDDFKFLFQIIDFDQVNEYENLKQNGWVGFADFYLGRFDKQSKPIDEMDKDIYSYLLELDTRLGTTASEQLIGCLDHTVNLDIIKVYSD